jgi:hypothetical protein
MLTRNVLGVLELERERFDSLIAASTGRSPTVPPLLPELVDTVCSVASLEVIGDADDMVPHYGCDNLYVTQYRRIGDFGLNALSALWGGDHVAQNKVD